MRELMTLAGAALLYTALALWVAAPPYTCAPISEPHRPLNLDREVDREHLQRDILAIPQMARRYVAHLPADARSGVPAADLALRQCEDELTRSLMTTHDLTADQVR
jgi:hypothetical protein